MLDIHSHILPKMDDGAKSVEMSLEMLHLSKAQGVDTIISTSHFYADSEAPERFLKRRAHAFEKLKPALDDDCPSILFGAEVLYFPGFSGSDSLASLKIEGTDLILIEMPFYEWNEKMFDELKNLETNLSAHVILAHVERYLPFQKKALLSMLCDCEFYLQCNAEAFTNRRTRRFALKLLKESRLDFLGSDCHNTTTRKPNMADAKKVIEKKCGKEVFSSLMAHSKRVLDRHTK